MAEKKEARRGLGRGLSALMADVAPTQTNADTDAPRRPDRLLPIESLRPNPDQPRRTFLQEHLDDLANSIRTKGVIQPLIVRPDPNAQGMFEIVAGERRWRAAQMAQLHEVPVLIRDFNDTEVLEVAIIENIQRADLNSIEEAAGYRQLMFKFGHTQEKLAEALGKSRSHIANLMRLLNLPESVQDMVTEGTLSAGHARALITAPNPEQLAKTIAEKGLSVRETEKLVKAGQNPEAPRKPTTDGTFKTDKDADTKALEGDLSAALGMKVFIDHKPGSEKGKITIAYESLEHLDSLCALLSTYR
ncbi:ParB/RepB/Spo0J family partition protein [Sagittula sp. S175]|uniref:ParB/RepB/Spo0J family partition protein n=1 Tax=Sagittula sp. S175 TaxID=3415129 RepID=UPI003C79B4AC